MRQQLIHEWLNFFIKWENGVVTMAYNTFRR